MLGVIPTKIEAGRLAESVLDDLAVDSVLSRGQTTGGASGLSTVFSGEMTDTQPGQVEGWLYDRSFVPINSDDLPGPVSLEQPAGLTAQLAAVLLAVGYWGHGSCRIATSPGSGVRDACLLHRKSLKAGRKS